VIKHLHKYSIGATSAIMTSMGMIAGLTQGAGAKSSIITGLLIIAIADNISDSFSIHVYKESEGASKESVDSTTYGNFLVRLLLVATFILIVLFFPSTIAFVISSLWGLGLLALLSYSIAKNKSANAVTEIGWHLAIAVLVIAGSKLLGDLILQTNIINH